MSTLRSKQLRNNFALLFWSKALIHLKIINIVVALFYLHRGLDLPHVFILGIVWAVTTLLFEVPSSYSADRWGRKKTLLVGVFVYVVSGSLLFFAHSFLVFAASTVLYALSYAMFSGTDEALIYDTTKELGISQESLKELGRLSSADRFLKIIAPIIGALIARDLVEAQFMILLVVDVIAALLAGIFVLQITEPNHYMDLEEQEAGVIKDAWKLLQKNPMLTRLILSRSLVFIAVFIIWRFHQEYFVQIGIPIVALGLSWSLFNIAAYFCKRNIHLWRTKKHLLWRVAWLNRFVLFGLIALLFALQFAPYAYLLLVLYFVFDLAEIIRWPLYSELFNQYSNSFNRATTLSLANLLKSILDIPLLFVGAWVVGVDITLPFYMAAAIVLLTVVFVDQYKAAGGGIWVANIDKTSQM